MATKKQKSYWYVLVLTNDGPTFVTKVNYSDKSAEWKKDEKPEEFGGEAWAKDLVLGLTWNGYTAFAVCSQFELDTQPYRYDRGHFVWRSNNNESNGEEN